MDRGSFQAVEQRLVRQPVEGTMKLVAEPVVKATKASRSQSAFEQVELVAEER